MSAAPYDFAQASELTRRASAAQKAAEDLLRSTSRDFAEKERAYRIALAKEIVTQHSEGAAWTVCQDLARGNPQVAQLRMERDIADGMREASQQRAWSAAADRKDLTQLINWSLRRDLAEDVPQPQWTRTAA
jgi:hypothetical protein